MKYYLVTIKCVNIKYTSMIEIEEVYRTVVNKLRGLEWSENLCWELDSLQRHHLHVIAVQHGKRDPFFKLVQRLNWTINFTEITEESVLTVTSYINKNSQNAIALDQRDWESKSKYELLFTECQKEG